MKDKKGIKLFVIATLVIGIGLVGFGLYSLLSQNNDSKKESSVPVDDNNTTEVIVNGVYQKDNTVIKIYKKNKEGIFSEKNVDINISTGDNYEVSLEANLSGNVIEDSIFDNKYTFTFSENSLDFTTNNENLTSGIYSKIGDYTNKDYFNDHFGSEEYINSKYTGEFQFGDIKAYLFQKDETTVQVYIIESPSDTDLFSSSTLAIDFEIADNDILEGSVFEDSYEIKFNADNSFVFETIESEEKIYDGTYSKTKALSMEDIINTFIAY